MENLRTCLCEPISELFDAARYLDAAASAHLAGKTALAEELIRAAEMPAIREWAESLWGPKSPHKQYRVVSGSPSSMPKADRIPARMPTTAEKKALLTRGGYHCRFCGIPLIRGEVRKAMRRFYPEALPWGGTNPEQHAGF